MSKLSTHGKYHDRRAFAPGSGCIPGGPFGQCRNADHWQDTPVQIPASERQTVRVDDRRRGQAVQARRPGSA